MTRGVKVSCGLHSVWQTNSWNSWRRQEWNPWQWSQERLIRSVFVSVQVQVRQLQDGQCFFVVSAASVFLHPGPDQHKSFLAGMLIFFFYASFRELMWAQSFSAGPSLRFMVLTRWSSVRSSRACPSISWERNSSATSGPPGGKRRDRQSVSPAHFCVFC